MAKNNSVSTLFVPALITFCIWLVVLSSINCEKVIQTLNFYSDLNCKHNRIIVNDSVPDIKMLKFRPRSVLSAGRWFLYGSSNYLSTTTTEGLTTDYFGTLFPIPTKCDQLDPEVGSIRYVGKITNYSADSLTTYQQKRFQGKQELFLPGEKNTSSLKTIESLVIVGCSPWTIYTRNHFKGNKTCIYPTKTCEPKLVENERYVVGSVRRTCFKN